MIEKIIKYLRIRKWTNYLITIYSKLPIKPFHGIFSKLYQKYRLFSTNKVVTATIDGIKYKLDLNEMIDNSIYYEGCFEPTSVAVINKYVRQGMTVLNIGANIGCHTLRFAKLVGGGKVIAFEPMSYAFKKLKQNVELNNFDNIILEKIALSNENKDNQSVYFYASWPLNRSLADTDIHHIHHGRKMSDIVDFVTLDNYVQRKAIKKIDFIKLDVDGYEYKVIQGGVNSIKKFKPDMLIEFVKYTLKEFGDNLESLIDLLDSVGYSFYSEKKIKRYGSKESLLSAIPPDGGFNVLCKPKISSKSGNFEG
jgi:FkbM family methyltransferase